MLKFLIVVYVCRVDSILLRFLKQKYMQNAKNTDLLVQKFIKFC